MNKYQEALNYITPRLKEYRTVKEDNSDFSYNNKCASDYDAIQSIQEIVNKATPMKPRYRPSGNIKCGCGLQMYEEQQDWYRYCSSCGQKIDWDKNNKEEE